MEKQLNIYKKIANFQQECPVILKGTKGYGYNYADLPSIFEVINPLLKKYKLGFTQLLIDENLKTIIFDIDSGETIESSVKIKQDVNLAKMNPFQVLGSAITYYRRYSIAAMLGIITDEDNDTNLSSQQPAKKENEPTEWLNKWTGKEHTKELPQYWKVVNAAKEKGLGVYELRQFYKINKEVAAELEKDLEDAILINLQSFIKEMGNDFAFLDRQKRITIDATDYFIDLLFYHRSLRRLVVIDLKLGKFKPEHEGQMLLYLRYLNKTERKEGEESPIGLILCSEGNTEHIEYLMLEDSNIKVAQYYTQLPDKKLLSEKLHRAIAIARAHFQK